MTAGVVAAVGMWGCQDEMENAPEACLPRHGLVMTAGSAARGGNANPMTTYLGHNRSGRTKQQSYGVVRSAVEMVPDKQVPG